MFFRDDFPYPTLIIGKKYEKFTEKNTSRGSVDVLGHQVDVEREKADPGSSRLGKPAPPGIGKDPISTSILPGV
jgi:hypothetical protein